MISPAAEQELLRILSEIRAMELSDAGWAERESSDMFQTQHLCGGYDADEEAFWFSYFPDDGGEFWFAITLAEATSAVSPRTLPPLEMRAAE